MRFDHAKTIIQFKIGQVIAIFSNLEHFKCIALIKYHNDVSFSLG